MQILNPTRKPYPNLSPRMVQTTTTPDTQVPGQSQPYVVRPYDWREVEEEGLAAIHCWALDRESNPMLIRFPRYQVSCRFALPDKVYLRGRGMVDATWDQTSAAYIHNILKQKLGDHAPTFFQFSHLKHIYYYGREGDYITCYFPHRDAMRHAINLCKKGLQTDRWGTMQLTAHEDEFDSVRKMCTFKNLQYCQWFAVSGIQVFGNDAISKIPEVIGNSNSVIPLTPEETKTWKANPGILSWDIEVYSHNHRLFPDKFNMLHEAYMITAVYSKGDAKPTRYGIIIGECNQSRSFPDAKIIRVHDEVQLIDAFSQVIEESNPEILAGYNIFSFDIPYLNQRLLAQACTWPNLSRLKRHQVTMKQTTWKSSAYGVQKLGDWDMPGRISLDMLPVITRDYKLALNNLNFVSKHFLQKEKHDVSAPEMFSIRDRLRTAKKRMRETITALKTRGELSISTAIETLDYSEREEIRSVVSEMQEAIAETTRVMDYGLQDSELVLLLMKKLHTWTALIEMSSIMGVTPQQLFTRGQQVRCMSQIYDLAYHMGYVINKRDSADYYYSGALVYPTVPGFHKGVLCEDFASLYPSIMQAYNISHDTFVPLVPGPEGKMIQDPRVADEDCNVITFTQREPTGEKRPAQNKYAGDFEIDLHDLINPENVEEDHDDDKDKKKKGKKEVPMVEKVYTFRFYKKRDGLMKNLEERLVGQRRAVNAVIKKMDEERGYLEACQKMYLSINSAANFGEWPTQKDADDYTKRKEKNRTFEKYYHSFVKMEEGQKRKEFERLKLELDQRKARIAELESDRVPLDKRQLAIKVSCNAFYGFLGVHNGGKLPLIEGAMCVTAKGRELITLAADYARINYGAVQIAGDTDSFMIKLPFLNEPEKYIREKYPTEERNGVLLVQFGQDKVSTYLKRVHKAQIVDEESQVYSVPCPIVSDRGEYWYWGQRLSEETSGLNPGDEDVDGVVWSEGKQGLFLKPLRMEFEKAMDGIWIKPKFYSAYLLDDDGNVKTKVTYDDFGKVKKVDKQMLLRGSILVRRDNCNYTRKVYKPITLNILEEKPFEDSWKMLFDAVIKLLTGKAEIDDLTMIKGLGENYKSPTNSMAVFSRYLARIGKPQEAGSRLPYLVVGTGVDAVGSKMRLQEQILDPANTEKINTQYYMERVLAGPLDTLMGVGYKEFIDKLDINFVARKGCKPTTLHTPIKLMSKYIKYGKGRDPVELLYELNQAILERCRAVREQ